VSTKEIDGVWFTIALNEKQELVACSFSDQGASYPERSVRSTLRQHVLQSEDNGEVGSEWFQRLRKLYSGDGVTGLDSLDLSGLSDFRKKVYNLLVRVPRGNVVTYGLLAEQLRSKQFARAVGTAMATNPVPLIIPCHRVLPSSLRIGNYGLPGRDPSQGGPVKRKLLEREGVRFDGGRVAAECVLTRLRDTPFGQG